MIKYGSVSLLKKPVTYSESWDDSVRIIAIRFLLWVIFTGVNLQRKLMEIFQERQKKDQIVRHMWYVTHCLLTVYWVLEPFVHFWLMQMIKIVKEYPKS